MIDPSELDTAEFPLPHTGERARPSSSSVHVDVAAKSDKGKKRETNQDHFLVSRAGRHLDTLMSNLPEGELPSRFDETGYIAIVADGMGGAAGGEVASRLAISTLINIVLHVPDWILRLDEEHAQKVMRRAASYYREVNERLVQEARLKPELRGMGTTMTGAYSLGDDLFVVHVGDSRAYLYRDGVLRRLTRDHTHAQMLADAGIIRPEAVGTHRLRHVLTNALGGEESEGNAEIHRMRLFDGDRILLCSDGLHDMVEDEGIVEILKRHKESSPACDALVERALENGGKDNVTVIVAGYSIPEVA
jgi:serine/threonine protein phosphatase PrpC